MGDRFDLRLVLAGAFLSTLMLAATPSTAQQGSGGYTWVAGYNDSPVDWVTADADLLVFGSGGSFHLGPLGNEIKPTRRIETSLTIHDAVLVDERLYLSTDDGLYEVLLVDATIRKAIMSNAGTDELRQVALDNGMLTLRMDGLKKVERGVTTLEEVVKETAVND